MKYITDNEEVFPLLESRRIQNVIVMGVLTNICILYRPFAIRQLRQFGYNIALMRDLTDSMYNPAMHPYVDHFTGKDLVVKHIEKNYCPTLTSDQIIGGLPFSFKEDTRGDSSLIQHAMKLPYTDVHWRLVSSYIEETSHHDYNHASDQAREAFMDMKYGVRIHWGLYSMPPLNDASWSFLRMSNEERQAYQELYKAFNPTGFVAREWMDFFAEAGMKYMVITTKHHEGFSLYETKMKLFIGNLIKSDIL